MEKQTSYRKEQLPKYIEKLKSMVERNFEIMIKPIESAITEDKFYNILKGRRMAAEQSIWGMKKVDACYKEYENLQEDEVSSYYRENLQELIDNLKLMFDLNLEVIDIELEQYDDDYERLKSVKSDIGAMLGKEITEAILRNASRDKSITEDKLHNVIKSRTVAAEDCDWILDSIEELESALSNKEQEVIKQSHAKRLAQKRKKALSGEVH